jgi:anti-anti-sigma factor
MEIIIEKLEEQMIVTLKGDLDTAASIEAEKKLEPVFNCFDSDLIIDCTELTYISSSGLRILLTIYKHIHEIGQQATLRHLNEDVSDVLTIGGVLQLFQIEP